MAEGFPKNPGKIVRSPRNIVPGNLDPIEPGLPYMVAPSIPEEEDGEDVKDEVEVVDSPDAASSETSSIETYSDENFDTDSEDCLQDYYTSSEEEEQFQYVDVGNGVKLKAPTDFFRALEHYKTSIWTTEERNKSLKPPRNVTNVKFVTNIFKLYTPENSFNSKEKKLTQRKRCIFSLVDEYSGKVHFQVPVGDTRVQLNDQDINSFWAWIECGDTWKAIKASLKNGYVEFSCDRLNSFGIIVGPKTVKNVIHPHGTTISTSKEDRLVLHFDKGSVDKEQSLKYSIQRPDQDYLKQSCNYHSLVASVGDKISLDYEMSKFTKPISLSGTLSCDENKGSDFEECDVKVIGFQDKRPVILNTITERVTDGRYTGKMEGCDGAALVAIKRGMEENEHFTETLLNELDLFYGNRMLCKLLLFHQSKNKNTLVFKAECCLLKNASVIIANNNHRRLIFESGNILLPPHQRIRIRPSGSIRLKPGIQFHPFLFFMHVPIENNTVFSVELEKGMGRSTNGTIEFSADNQRRGEIAKTEFSLDFLTSGSLTETLIRTNSTLSDDFRSGSACSRGTNFTV